MKVVLFCGGMGMRLRDYSDVIPKPLVPVGARPIMWNLMRYYAHFGHKEFILCLGHRAQAVKEYFLQYNEALSNDFILSGRGKVTLLGKDIEDWTITFCHTGLRANIGERLLAVRPHLEGEEMFLANYADGLSDLPLDVYLDAFHSRNVAAGFITVPVPHAFHVVETDADQSVKRLLYVGESNICINGGFFAFRSEIFDYIRPGEELVIEPFARLIEAGQLMAYPYRGFWRSMDTFKDKVSLDELDASGRAPWQVWRRRRDATTGGS